MNSTSYPHHHSHPHDLMRATVRPICAYCLHLLETVQGSLPMSASMRRKLEDDHQCIEKTTARLPDAALPYN